MLQNNSLHCEYLYFIVVLLLFVQILGEKTCCRRIEYLHPDLTGHLKII